MHKNQSWQTSVNNCVLLLHWSFVFISRWRKQYDFAIQIHVQMSISLCYLMWIFVSVLSTSLVLLWRYHAAACCHGFSHLAEFSCMVRQELARPWLPVPLPMRPVRSSFWSMVRRSWASWLANLRATWGRHLRRRKRTLRQSSSLMNWMLLHLKERR